MREIFIMRSLTVGNVAGYSGVLGVATTLEIAKDCWMISYGKMEEKLKFEESGPNSQTLAGCVDVWYGNDRVGTIQRTYHYEKADHL